MRNPDSAAAKLNGLKLEGGWRVVRAIAQSPSATGGQFSNSYEVENEDGRHGFLKAFDFSRAFEPGRDTISELTSLLAGYMSERDILLHCKNRHHSKIVLPLDHGFTQVPNLGDQEGRVYYLILDMADGDIRSQVDVVKRLDTLSSVRALNDICLGLWQVHRDMIAHQDVKPSNVLVYKETADFRVTDFGCASRRGVVAPRDQLRFPGDNTYAPPEAMYGELDSDFVKRRIGCDLYMFGNIACFLFAGINVTANLMSHLAPQYHPGNWHGSYQLALPYLMNAFTATLEDLHHEIDEEVREVVLRMIQELCTPDVARRGHSRGIGRVSQYSLERYVSELDLLKRRVEIRARLKKTA